MQKLRLAITEVAKIEDLKKFSNEKQDGCLDGVEKI